MGNKTLNGRFFLATCKHVSEEGGKRFSFCFLWLFFDEIIEGISVRQLGRKIVTAFSTEYAGCPGHCVCQDVRPKQCFFPQFPLHEIPTMVAEKELFSHLNCFSTMTMVEEKKNQDPSFLPPPSSSSSSSSLNPEF